MPRVHQTQSRQIKKNSFVKLHENHSSIVFCRDSKPSNSLIIPQNPTPNHQQLLCPENSISSQSWCRRTSWGSKIMGI
ncbi:hypothetical protein TorRG33x02_062370 [Trema orientale]|uniref:Uncharacterized protein n=1 Tax=Trema orientale TaxID=63057 RepID=A0A2P5FJG1_TREOI|nr:hypothetical protein TorRG33x02_062370 [Trema orientale]